MITTKDRSKLRAMGALLRPLVNIGKGGLNPSIVAEIDNCLFHHELVKIGILQSCDTPAKAVMAELVAQIKCEPIQCIGGKVVVYKYSTKEDVKHIQY